MFSFLKISHMFHAMTEIRPVVATAISGATLAANASVWFEAIRGWAAVATVFLGVPTAFFILVYWAIKARYMHYEWKNRRHIKKDHELH